MPSSSRKALEKAPNSGIQTTSDGERHIPQSVRADGSVRKEIKIRPGYRPPEDVEVYKNKTAQAWKTKGLSGPPGAEGLKENIKEAEAKNTLGRNAKRREARRRAKAADGTADGADPDEEDGAAATMEKKDTTSTVENTIRTNGSVITQPDPAPTEATDPGAEREKQARNLKKKLRQARELKEKKESGGDLLPEQFAKIIKIQELIRQLDALGFDEEGEAKTSKEG